MAGLEIASERKHFRVPQRVFVMRLLLLEIPSQRDGVVYSRQAWNVPRMLAVTLGGAIYGFGEGLRLESGREKGFSRGIQHSLTQKAATDLGAAKLPRVV